MPVYITRAHVTIGDKHKSKQPRKGPIVPKHVFHVSDIVHTPYCVRTIFVTFIGCIIVSGGIVMTIIGYKPGILLPWYRSNNNTINFNVTSTSAVPSVLGEPGPLRVLVYIGPILMGLGVFLVMVVIVLFCEIKDRYFNNILPKVHPEQRAKNQIYDRIIEEFRKNYFRGIEVPLKPTVRKNNKSRFSFSLSRSGSLLSFGRRISHDFQRRKRKHSRESQTERTHQPKYRRPSIKKLTYNDTWMKTSSLPNIRQKESVPSIYQLQGNKSDAKETTLSPKEPIKVPVKILSNNGLDNPAFTDLAIDSRVRPPLKKHSSLDTHDRNTHVTTVIVHREKDKSYMSGGFLPELNCSRTEPGQSPNYDGYLDVSIINIDTDINLIPNNEICLSPATHMCYIDIDKGTDSGVFGIPRDRRRGNIDSCKCDETGFCELHALGMDSPEESLNLSWENIPSSSNERRNTEPIVFYKRSFNSVTNSDSRMGSLTQSVEEHADDNSTHSPPKHAYHPLTPSKLFGRFKTSIMVCKSDSYLPQVGKHLLLQETDSDVISLDSLNLTDDMMKHFELNNTSNT